MEFCRSSDVRPRETHMESDYDDAPPFIARQICIGSSSVRMSALVLGAGLVGTGVRVGPVSYYGAPKGGRRSGTVGQERTGHSNGCASSGCCGEADAMVAKQWVCALLRANLAAPVASAHS